MENRDELTFRYLFASKISENDSENASLRRSFAEHNTNKPLSLMLNTLRVSFTGAPYSYQMQNHFLLQSEFPIACTDSALQIEVTEQSFQETPLLDLSDQKVRDSVQSADIKNASEIHAESADGMHGRNRHATTEIIALRDKFKPRHLFHIGGAGHLAGKNAVHGQEYCPPEEGLIQCLKDEAIEPLALFAVSNAVYRDYIPENHCLDPNETIFCKDLPECEAQGVGDDLYKSVEKTWLDPRLSAMGMGDYIIDDHAQLEQEYRAELDKGVAAILDECGL